MLTLIAILACGVTAFGRILRMGLFQIVRVPGFVAPGAARGGASLISASAGIAAAVLMHQWLNTWPPPAVPLDVAGLVDAGSAAGRTHETGRETAMPFFGGIPPELQRDTAWNYASSDPFVIGGLPLEGDYWIEGMKDAEGTGAGGRAAKDGPETGTPDVEGIEHVVRAGENLWEIAKAYQNKYRGVTYEKILAFNPGINPRRMMPKDKVFIPHAEEAVRVQRNPLPRVRKPQASPSSRLGPPLSGALITSGYGMRKHPIGGSIRFHHGVDFKGRRGEPIFAAAAGVVTYAGWKGSLGKVVEIEHENGLTTLYAHASQYMVQKGQTVARGQQIARVGSTGRTTGAHLHFEVRRNGKSQNPINYLTNVRYDTSS